MDGDAPGLWKAAMAMNIDLKPEVEAELSRQAAAHGVELDAYAASLLEEAVHTGGAPKPFTKEELGRTLDELSQFSHKIPLLSDDAFSRNSLYPDRD